MTFAPHVKKVLGELAEDVFEHLQEISVNQPHP